MKGQEFNPCYTVAENNNLQKAGPLEVVVDDRERNSGVIEHLHAQESIRVTVRRLELGDYLVNQRVLVERKTVADLGVSIVDGRLFSQACRLAESPYRPLLVIEGHVGSEGALAVSRAAIQGAMVTLALFLDIPCLRSFDTLETANLIRYVGEQIQRRISRAIYRHGYRPRRLRNRQVFILQGLPGIGPVRAECLLDAFGSVEKVFCADVDALTRVKGMGRKTAEAIRALIGAQGQT
jgi:DNA excision repair protein ERCC-4